MSPENPSIVLSGEDIKRLANYDVPDALKDVPYSDMIESLTRNDKYMDDVMSVFAIMALVRMRDGMPCAPPVDHGDVTIRRLTLPGTVVGDEPNIFGQGAQCIPPDNLLDLVEVMGKYVDLACLSTLLVRLNIPFTMSSDKISIPTEHNEATVHFYFKADGRFDSVVAYPQYALGLKEPS